MLLRNLMKDKTIKTTHLLDHSLVDVHNNKNSIIDKWCDQDILPYV
jgi:hypothetical protein